MRKELYISDIEVDVIKKLNEIGKGKVSNYIVELIKQDICGSKNLAKEEIIALIMQYGQNKNTALPSYDNNLESSIQSVLNLLD